jgi:hypothetical protein
MRPPRIIPRFFILSLIGVAATHAAAEHRFLNLMPRPSAVLLTEGRFHLSETFTVGALGRPGDRARRAADRFLERLSGRTGLVLRKRGSPSRKEGKAGRPCFFPASGPASSCPARMSPTV